MNDLRAKTRETIGRLNIPKTTVAQLSNLSGTEISAYLHGHTVSAHNTAKIEHAVEDVAELVEFMRFHFGLRPDMRDTESLRSAVTELKNALRLLDMQSQVAATATELTEATAEASQAFQAAVSQQ